MEQKKATRAELEKRIKNAQLIIDKGKKYKAFYFADRGIGIYICQDYVVSTTNFHQHVWNRINSAGYNSTCLILESLVDIANTHAEEIQDKNERGEIYYSLDKLRILDTLTETEKIIIQMVEKWLYLINDSIHSLSNNPILYGSNNIKYFTWHALQNAFINNENKDVSYNDLIDRYLAYQAFLFSGNGVDEGKVHETLKECNAIMKKALKDIRDVNIKNGSKSEDFIIIPKQDDDEAKALNEIQH